VFAAAVERI